VNCPRVLRRLAVTPAPMRGELPISYLLRLSEANGFQTPIELCKRLRKNEPYRSTVVLCFPSESLSRLTGWNPETFRALGGQLDCKAAFQTVHGVAFLGSVDRRSVARPMVCPKCVAENGWVDSSWGLTLVRACPVHRLFGVSVCGRCGKQISWERASMGACNCGCPIQASNDVAPEEEELATVCLLRSLFFPHADSPAIADRLGFPIEGLRKLTLRDLARLLRNLAALTESTRYSVKDSRQDDALRAGRILAQWPERFVALLESHKKSLSRKELLHLLFREPLLSNKRKESLDASDSLRFLSDGIQAFLEKSDLMYLIDPRYAKRFGWQSPWASPIVAAQRLGIEPRSVRAIARSGKIKIKRLGRRMFVALEPDLAELARAWSRIDERAAASLIGLPVRTLHACIQANVLPDLSAACCKGFSLVRTRSARERLDLSASRNVACVRNPQSPWRLGDIMHSSRFDTKLKVSLVELSLAQQLPVVEGADCFSDIVVDLGQMFVEYRPTGVQKKGWIAYGWVPHCLFCGYYGPAELARRGHLEDRKVGMLRYVSLTSLEQFRKKYVSVCELGMALGKSARQMVTICMKSIPVPGLLVLPPKMGVFVRRSHVDALELVFGKLPFDNLVISVPTPHAGNSAL